MRSRRVAKSEPIESLSEHPLPATLKHSPRPTMIDPQYSSLDPTALARFGRLELIARLVVEGLMSGLHKSPFKGFSVEFAEHRQYGPGDEIRHIDWRAFGKTDRHYVKEYEEETNLRAHLVVELVREHGLCRAHPLEIRARPTARGHDGVLDDQSARRGRAGDVRHRRPILDTAPVGSRPFLGHLQRPREHEDRRRDPAERDSQRPGRTHPSAWTRRDPLGRLR